MEQSTELGTNKTGMDMSPIDSKKMIAGAEEMIANLHPGSTSLLGFRQSYLENTEALGSVPLPGTVKGVVKSTLKMVTGKHPEVFINKLGERLAYERSGVRIYEQLIAKCQYASEQDMAAIEIPIETLLQFRDEEAAHFDLLESCLKELGADPTAQTPDADAVAVGASGLMKVVADPRTSISQTLLAMLSLELADNDAWDLLIKLAADMGLNKMAEEFRVALHQEDVHLEQVREWYESSVRIQAKASPSLN